MDIEQKNNILRGLDVGSNIDVEEFHDAYTKLLNCALTLMGAERKLEGRANPVPSTYEMEHLIRIIHTLETVSTNLRNVLESYGFGGKP